MEFLSVLERYWHVYVLFVCYVSEYVLQVMSVKDGCVDSPWLTSTSSALADVTNSPLGVTSRSADDMTSEDGTAGHVLDLSQRQTFTAASTSSADVTAGAVSGPDWCDVIDDDDDDESDQHTLMSLTSRTSSPFTKRSCTGPHQFCCQLCSLLINPVLRAQLLVLLQLVVGSSDFKHVSRTCSCHLVCF